MTDKKSAQTQKKQKTTKTIKATLPLTNAEVDEQKNDSDHDTHAADDDVRDS